MQSYSISFLFGTQWKGPVNFRSQLPACEGQAASLHSSRCLYSLRLTPSSLLFLLMEDEELPVLKPGEVSRLAYLTSRDREDYARYGEEDSADEDDYGRGNDNMMGIEEQEDWEEDEEESKEGKKRELSVTEADDLLYDPTRDDKDAKWVHKQLAGKHLHSLFLVFILSYRLSLSLYA